ncbi:outer membrane beta-barrel family protein [Pedobacter sp. MC2016-14]|uniref:outer membrane beta-barrel protein n=1 Tax=Pedobacter sp. MC2016-14 TaxID=2897327 RepID=UPI001E489258|nr:outer membrane beta-barrel protein [Pedobacter sp. MC2016-14]MCD0490268.1 outer membrane beta-barrel family protein [Pedobacter sp. MC2016-14]
MKYINLIFAFSLLCAASAHAQGYKVTGSIRDSLNKVVAGAKVELISGQDTLLKEADYRGKFNISGFNRRMFSITINTIGYMPYSRMYEIPENQFSISLPNIILEKDANTLKEVIINGQVVPIRLMKDTIEYNAAAYLVLENDRVEDLLRQLPGISIDRDGKVIAMGRVMNKLRINGEDFFTNSVKDFVSQLPADMIAKLQVINDYGDEANFTGIKTGSPEKMLNLVTKPGRNKGNFGNTSASAGTNERYGLQANGNLWREKKQIGIKGNALSTNGAGGINRTISTGINYRDKISEELTGSIAYNFDNLSNKNHQLEVIETITNQGSIFNTNDYSQNTKSNKHNLNWNVQSVGKTNFLQAGVTGSFLNSKDEYTASSLQTGLTKQGRQEIANLNNTEIYNPEFNANFAFAHKMEKPGRNISFGFTAKNGRGDTDEDLDNHTRYFVSSVLLKDSILNRLVDTRNVTRNLGASFRFSEPFYRKDSLASMNLDFYYNFALEANDNDLVTRVNNFSTNGLIVDSLSTVYTSRFTSHLFGLNFRYGSQTLSYSLGLSGQPNLLTVQNERPQSQIRHVGFNLAPIANISYNLNERTSLTLVYTGNSVAPTFMQLQPVPNTRNLQNVLIGNPNLRSTFSNTVNLSYQNTNPENGRAIMYGVNGNVVRGQIVSNVIVVEDKLKSLKRETRLTNANGNYSVDGLYSWSMPFVHNQYNLEFRGTIGIANSVSYTDNIKTDNEGFNLSQAAMLRMNLKGFTLGGDANYSYSSNRYSIALQNLKNIQIWEFNLNAKVFINRTLILGLDGSKRINQGYAFDAANPLLLNASIQKSFLKRQQATIKLQAYDLLNQGNSLVRSVFDNTIVDSRSNQITRYFQLSFNINLQQFGF